MSKDFTITDDMYLVLLRYYNGDVIYLTKDINSKLKKGTYLGEPIPEIKADILRTFDKIIKLKEKILTNTIRLTGFILNGMRKPKKKIKETFESESEGYTPDSPGYTPDSPGYTPDSPGYTLILLEKVLHMVTHQYLLEKKAKQLNIIYLYKKRILVKKLIK